MNSKERKSVKGGVQTIRDIGENNLAKKVKKKHANSSTSWHTETKFT